MADLTEDQLDQMLADIGLRARPVLPHGTPGAYRRHLRHGETPCDACRKANTERQASQVARAQAGGGDPSRRKPIAHGTPRGYKQHRYRGEQACEDCTRAERNRQRKGGENQ